jgi:CheY-like chemotaxis protein
MRSNFCNEWKTGLASAKLNKPDVIICDIMMPETDGYEVIGKLKNDIETSHIPFIFLTASAEKRDKEAGYAMGANGYIRKPFDAVDLFAVVEKCLNAE